MSQSNNAFHLSSAPRPRPKCRHCGREIYAIEVRHTCPQKQLDELMRQARIERVQGGKRVGPMVLGMLGASPVAVSMVGAREKANG